MTEVYVNNREARRFELAIDGDVAAWVDYELGLGTIALNHTEVLPEFRGRGLAGDIVVYALAHAQLERLRVVPSCSFVASFIGRNAEYQDLVA
jgi:uncharacterized protein